MTNSHKNFSVAIVGAGPAGFFTAQAFQRAQNADVSFKIDMIERLPTPWGLVRSGVAPDHVKIKTVSKVFEKIAKDSRLRLFANVEVGKDISLKDLQMKYDAVVLATGAPIGRKLKIPGEDLSNCLSSAEFVSWYNSHPDFTDVEIDLSPNTAVIIGMGNVALDVARMLAIEPKKLDVTDISEYALERLKLSKIDRIVICGRRGPEYAAFTVSELRELTKLDNVLNLLDSSQISDSISRIEKSIIKENDSRKIVDCLNNIISQDQKEFKRKIEFKFMLSPKEIKGNDKVEQVIFAVNEIKDGKVVETESTYSINAGLVITAIGHESVEIPGITIENGRIGNIAGHIKSNLYVTGWAKRGSVGLIGTNKSDSIDLVNLIIENLREPKNMIGIESLLRIDHRVVDNTGWEKINAHEVISGNLLGKPRVKESNWERLINLGTS